LLRLHDWQVDERRRELGVLVAREDSLIRMGEELARQLAHEQQVVTNDPITAGFLYAAFAGDHLRRCEELERTLADLRNEIEQAHERLAEAYRQLKVYEEIEEERVLQQRLEDARQDQKAFDEISQNQHRLKQG
jgi:flagellar export protein FliJ